MEGKICSKCGEFKSYNEFNKRKGSKDGYMGQCKQCRKEYDKQYNDSHKEEHKQYRDSHKEYFKEYDKQYRKSHKEERKEYRKQYYESNKEGIKEKSKQYNNSHKEERKEYRKQYRDSHKEEIKEYKKKQNKQYRESHKEEIKAYRDSHKEEMKKYRKYIKDNNIMIINEIIKTIGKYNLINKHNIPIYGYIYKIENIKTGRVYIGQTIRPLTHRYNSNIIEYWKNERLNKNNQKFKNELLNINDFKLTEILDVGICKYHLDKLEVYYINLYDSYNNGYNNNNGNHKTDDGIEEFKEILQYYNINESELILGGC